MGDIRGVGCETARYALSGRVRFAGMRRAPVHRQYLGIVVLGVTVATLSMTAGCSNKAPIAPGASTSGVATTQQQAPQRPLTAIQLSRTARRAAASLGEQDPTRLQALLTTRSQANHLVGDEVYDNVPAYLIEINGTFSTAWESRPYGAAVPPTETGTLTLVVDARTGHQLDTGLGPDRVNLGQIGTALDLP